MPTDQSQLSIEQCVEMACLLEVTAAKPGNVHRGADFEDITYQDFILAGNAIAPVLERASSQELGAAILESIQATRSVIATNANLGIVLMLAPLTAVPREEDLQSGIKKVLENLTAADATNVYEAIRLAKPGGMGKVEQGDIENAPPSNLLEAMQLAAERDSIAKQYVTDFVDLWNVVIPSLQKNIARLPTLTAIVCSYLEILVAMPDTLIARKSGSHTAQQASDWAADVLNAGEQDLESYYHALADFDFWLRSDGNKRNPGTTADLVCAGLFVGLRDGWLKPPFTWE
jgi:triphosphoribosyl-dephospho-CoA synthase